MFTAEDCKNGKLHIKIPAALLKWALNFSMMIKSKKHVENLGRGCLIKIVITISWLFRLYSQFNLNVLYSNVPSLVYHDAYRRTICIMKTIFVLLSLIKTSGLWLVTPLEFGTDHWNLTWPSDLRVPSHSEVLYICQPSTYPTESKMNGTYLRGINVAMAQVVRHADRAG